MSHGNATIAIKHGTHETINQLLKLIWTPKSFAT